jgi:hypothetical protein
LRVATAVSAQHRTALAGIRLLKIGSSFDNLNENLKNLLITTKCKKRAEARFLTPQVLRLEV